MPEIRLERADMRICFLGTRNVDPDRRTSLGVVVHTDGEYLLMDAGPYVVQGLKSIGLSPDDIGAVFVSHDHADHCGGIPAFVMTWLLGSATRPESFLWAVPHERLAIADYARAAYPALFAGSGPRRAVIVREDLTIGSAAVTWLRLDHAVETWGARVTDATVSLAYLPDSTASGMDKNSAILNGTESIVMSVTGPSHRSAEAERFKFPVATQVGELASKWGPRRLFVQHLADPAESSSVADEIRLRYDGEVIFPKAGEWFDLG